MKVGEHKFLVELAFEEFDDLCGFREDDLKELSNRIRYCITDYAKRPFLFKVTDLTMQKNIAALQNERYGNEVEK